MYTHFLVSRSYHRICCALTFMCLTLSFCTEAQTQNVDSLIRVVTHSQSAVAINDAKRFIPEALSKVDMRILDLITQLKAEGISTVQAAPIGLSKRFSNNLFQVDDRGYIFAYVFLHQFDPPTLEWLKMMGVFVQHANLNSEQITCRIPFDVVETIATNQNVLTILPVAKPRLQTGTYTTAGDGLLRADVARSIFGFGGNNIKVGVISDGVDHASNSISSGDLPSSFQVVSNNVGGDEGTAMSEIVYDLAPGASLAFADYGDGSEDGMAAQIQNLIIAGCSVIVDDILIPTERVFEDGPLANAVNSATAANVKYLSCAGNYGLNSWESQSADANQNSWMEFSGTDETNRIAVDPGDTLYAWLQWANKWNQAHDDYDLYLFENADPSSQVLAASINRQTGTGVPFESLMWANTTVKPKVVYLRVKIYSVASPRRVKLETYMNTPRGLYYTTEYALFGHAAATSCISAGAMGAPAGNYLENFSSHGPSRIYTYDSNGNPVSFVDRQTPSVAGIDGVQTYVGMSGNWYPFPPSTLFKGTSAAAPHVAGVVALILSANSSLNWQQVKQTLDSTCTIVNGMSGQPDNGYGYGRPDAYKALKYVIEHYNATIGGVGTTITLHENINTSSGTTLTVLPGTTIQMDQGCYLAINGTINAQSVTFDKTSGASSWYGLILQSGSSGTISYCNFNHATVGVSCNSSAPTISNCTFLNNYFGIYCNPCTPSIQYNDIENSSNSGIYLTGASPNLTGNTIKNNSQYGVFCLNYSGPAMASNTISGSQLGGLYCDYHSCPTLYSIAGVGNVISLTSGSAIDIYANHYSNPFLGFGGSSGNSIEGNPWYYVAASNGSNVIAQGNWWGSYPPNASRFNMWPGGTIDYSRALPSDPNPGRPKVQAPGEGLAAPIIAFISDSTFNLAFQDGLAGKYDDAIALYMKVYNANPKTSLLAKQALLFLADTYERSGKSGFIDLLHTQINPTIPAKTELSVISRELEAHWLTKSGSYTNAINIYQALHADYPDSAEIDKHALFNIGEIYQTFLNDRTKAVEYLGQFQAKYPKDPLAAVAGFLMTSTAGSFMPSQQKDGGTVATKDPIPFGFALESNYPNPFNPSTQIRYSLPEAGNVSLVIYDVLGREIANLADGYQQTGRYTVTWNSTQNSGVLVSSGVYFARLRVTDDLGMVKFTKTMRLLLMK